MNFSNEKYSYFITKNHGFLLIILVKTMLYGFFALMFNLTKVPFWNSHFRHDHFD